MIRAFHAFLIANKKGSNEKSNLRTTITREIWAFKMLERNARGVLERNSIWLEQTTFIASYTLNKFPLECKCLIEFHFWNCRHLERTWHVADLVEVSNTSRMFHCIRENYHVFLRTLAEKWHWKHRNIAKILYIVNCISVVYFPVITSHRKTIMFLKILQ